MAHQLSSSAGHYDLQLGQASMNANCPLLNIIFSSLTPATSARCLLCAFSLCPARARPHSALNEDAQQRMRRAQISTSCIPSNNEASVDNAGGVQSGHLSCQQCQEHGNGEGATPAGSGSHTLTVVSMPLDARRGSCGWPATQLTMSASACSAVSSRPAHGLCLVKRHAALSVASVPLN